MKRAIVLQHAEFEGPARVGELLVDSGYALDVRAVFRGDAVPRTLERGDLLLMMGGPMGVADRSQPETEFLQKEIDLLARCVADAAPVLGICLGAQLLAHAAGAAVRPMTRADGGRVYEVGWGPITFAPRSGDEGLAGLPAAAHVLHWHGDTFDLPAGAVLLASSSACPHQGFRLGRRMFGLQFHCEVERAHVDAFLRVDADYVVQANGADGVARLRADTERFLVDSRRSGDILLRNILRAMTAE